MAAPTYLKVTLKLMALYAGVMGALAAFFQDAGSFIFGHTITDPMITRYWGGVLLAMSIFYFFLSMEPDKYRLFIWVGIFDLGIAMVFTAINLSTEAIGVVQGLVGVILNPIFVVILLYGIAKEPEGEVLFVTTGETKEGGEENTPEHSRSRHPLHGK